MGTLLIVALAISTGCDRSSPPESASQGTVEAEQHGEPQAAEDADASIAFPRNEWACTDESRAQIDGWFEAMNHHYGEVPWRLACDEMPEIRERIEDRLPTGVDRIDEFAELIRSDSFINLPVPRPFHHPGVLESRDRQGEINLRMIALKSEQMSSGLEQVLQDRQDPVVGFFVSLPHDLKFKHAALLLSIALHQEPFQNGDLRIAAVTAVEEISSTPDGVEGIPDHLRERLYQTLGQPCSLDEPAFEAEQFNILNAELQEGVEACEYRVQHASGSSLPLAMVHPRDSTDGGPPLDLNELGEFWKNCGCEPDIEALAALLFLSVGMEEVRPLSMVEFKLSDEGTPLEVSPDDTWQEVVNRLQAHHGETISLALPEMPDEPAAAPETPEIIMGLPDSEDDRLDPEILLRAVRQHRRELHHCYEQALHGRPDLAGGATLRWTIAPDGSASGISLRDGSSDFSHLERCIQQRMVRWRFPPLDSQESLTVDLPLRFVAPQR